MIRDVGRWSVQAINPDGWRDRYARITTKKARIPVPRIVSEGSNDSIRQPLKSAAARFRARGSLSDIDRNESKNHSHVFRNHSSRSREGKERGKRKRRIPGERRYSSKSDAIYMFAGTISRNREEERENDVRNRHMIIIKIDNILKIALRMRPSHISWDKRKEELDIVSPLRISPCATCRSANYCKTIHGNVFYAELLFLLARYDLAVCG